MGVHLRTGMPFGFLPESRSPSPEYATDNPNAVSGAVGLIEKLIETSIPMDRKFIARIKRMVVVKQFVGAGSKAKFTPNNHREPVTWLLGVHDINDPKNPDELKRIESGSAKAKLFLENPKSSLSWIRYGRKAKAAEARRGDNLIIISRDAQKANAQWVYPHAPVLRVQNEPNCIRLFYEQVPSAKKKSLSWIEFKKLAKQAGLHGEISKNTTRQLTDGVSANLHDYWEQVQRK